MDMNEEQILMRARREVAARRVAKGEQRWDGIWRWLLSVLVLTILAAFFLVPWPLPRKLLLAMGGVCALRPSHSYFAGGLQFPLEARTTGIFAGFLLTLLALAGMRRVGAQRLGGPVVVGLLLLMVASMALDGINSTLPEINLPHLYTTTNPIRLVTGVLAGIGLAPFLVWLWGVVATPCTTVQRAVVRSPWELSVPLAFNAGFAALVVDGRAAFFYPVAVISVAGVVALLAGVALLPLLVLTGLEGRVMRARQIFGPSALALLLAFAVLALTATLRWTMTG